MSGYYYGLPPYPIRWLPGETSLCSLELIRRTFLSRNPPHSQPGWKSGGMRPPNSTVWFPDPNPQSQNTISRSALTCLGITTVSVHLGFRVSVSSFRNSVLGLGFRVSGSRFRGLGQACYYPHTSASKPENRTLKPEIRNPKSTTRQAHPSNTVSLPLMAETPRTNCNF